MRCHSALTATAWANTLDGQQYPACTTVQYGYEPAFNTTTLTVSTPSTEVVSTVKSPEEMQKEAEDVGGFTVYHEFGWWYPWYRLHFVVQYKGATMIDIGLAALHFVPDPINVWFYPAFIIASFIFAATAFHYYSEWAA